MFFADLDAREERLLGLRLVPLQSRRFRLQCASADDIRWLCDLANRMGLKVRRTNEESESVQSHNALTETAEKPAVAAKRFGAWLDRPTASRQIAAVNRALNPHPAGHVLLPSAAIGGLSVVLAAGLELLGVLPRMNVVLGRLVSRNGAETFPEQLPEWGVWLAVAALAFGTAAAVLGTPGSLRRMLLWLSAVILVAAWAPVLSLAARAPDIAAPLVATIWSGICALVYVSRHRMPVDQNQAGTASRESPGA